MEIKGSVHCFFEQSGTFKNEFKKLGYKAYDYDIQNNYEETDYQYDLFREIERAYVGTTSIFDDKISNDDLIIAFFPCIYFESMSMLAFNWSCHNYRKLNKVQATEKIIIREKERSNFYIILLKFISVCMERDLRMILENPYNEQHFFKQGNFVKKPDYIDHNRMRRGDYFIKPTAYWFFNCEPTTDFTEQNDKEKRTISKTRGAKQTGLCSEERSIIHPDYARNFICDNIIGKPQNMGQLNLFNKII